MKNLTLSKLNKFFEGYNLTFNDTTTLEGAEFSCSLHNKETGEVVEYEYPSDAIYDTLIKAGYATESDKKNQYLVIPCEDLGGAEAVVALQDFPQYGITFDWSDPENFPDFKRIDFVYDALEAIVEDTPENREKVFDLVYRKLLVPGCFYRDTNLDKYTDEELKNAVLEFFCYDVLTSSLYNIYLENGLGTHRLDVDNDTCEYNHRIEFNSTYIKAYDFIKSLFIKGVFKYDEFLFEELYSYIEYIPVNECTELNPELHVKLLVNKDKETFDNKGLNLTSVIANCSIFDGLGLTEDELNKMIV